MKEGVIKMKDLIKLEKQGWQALSTYVLSDGTWKLAHHQQTPV